MDFGDAFMVGLTYEKSLGCLAGAFLYRFLLEWVDAVAEFVG